MVVNLVTDADSTAAVKRALLADITRLCIFMQRQATNDLLLPLLITFLNDRETSLRAAFFESISGVCAFVGQGMRPPRRAPQTRRGRRVLGCSLALTYLDLPACSRRALVPHSLAAGLRAPLHPAGAHRRGGGRGGRRAAIALPPLRGLLAHARCTRTIRGSTRRL